MSTASRFKARPSTNHFINLTIDGQSVLAKPGDSVAAAMLAYSGDAMRHTVKGSPRAAYCMMGVCFDCLVEVDGYPNTQACMVQVKEGMVIRRQQGLRKLKKEPTGGE